MHHYVEHVHALTEDIKAGNEGKTILVVGEVSIHLPIKSRKLASYFNKKGINYFQRYENTFIIKNDKDVFSFIESIMNTKEIGIAS